LAFGAESLKLSSNIWITILSPKRKEIGKSEGNHDPVLNFHEYPMIFHPPKIEKLIWYVRSSASMIMQWLLGVG